MLRKNSLKRNLIITLFITLFATLTAIYFISFANTKHKIREAFDANLVKSSKLIFGLIKHEAIKEENLQLLTDFNSTLHQKIFHKYEYILHSQAWINDKLIYSSDNNFESSKPEYQGFKDVIINDVNWRSFAFYDSDSGIKILVLEQSQLRNRLIFEILLSLLFPLFLSFIPLFFIVIAVVNNKLKPLNNIAIKIEKMSGKTLELFKDKDSPLELEPFINSFNALLKRLSQSIEAERRFTDYAAHELKTPLAAIKTQAQLLTKNKNKEKEEEYLQDLLDGVERANHMVSQLLTLARIESHEIKKEKLNYKNLISLTIKNHQQKAEEKNLFIKFESELKDDEALILANRTHIEILLNNLLDNAIKYSFAKKEIAITLTKQRQSTILEVRNYGEDLSPDEIANVFNNFYRVNRNSMTHDNTGSGLGLAIVKKIVDLYFGTISFASEKGQNIVKVKLSF